MEHLWQLTHTTFPLESKDGSRGRVLRLPLICCRRCFQNWIELLGHLKSQSVPRWCHKVLILLLWVSCFPFGFLLTSAVWWKTTELLPRDATSSCNQRSEGWCFHLVREGCATSSPLSSSTLVFLSKAVFLELRHLCSRSTERCISFMSVTSLCLCRSWTRFSWVLSKRWPGWTTDF